jgi:hypothetical protein
LLALKDFYLFAGIMDQLPRRRRDD